MPSERFSSSGVATNSTLPPSESAEAASADSAATPAASPLFMSSEPRPNIQVPGLRHSSSTSRDSSSPCARAAPSVTSRSRIAAGSSAIALPAGAPNVAYSSKPTVS